MAGDEIIRKLTDCAAEAKALGATSLYLFGSVARDEATPDSDVDLFLDYDPGSRFSLMELVGLKSLLEDRIGRPIDVTTRDSLHPLLRDDIERSAIRIY